MLQPIHPADPLAVDHSPPVLANPESEMDQLTPSLAQMSIQPHHQQNGVANGVIGIGPSRQINPLTGNPFSRRYFSLFKQRSQLPIWRKKDEFNQLLNEHQCILLEAETGSGKSSQVPQWCVDWVRTRWPHSRHMVCCTQPRRLATVAVAKRVAEEMDVQLGEEVGYSIRFGDVCSFNTLLKYCTDGILLNEATKTPTLDSYAVILLDEVHERTLTTDVLMGLIKELMRQRADLRVVVMSASLNTGNFEQYFVGSTKLRVEGRSFPVEIKHHSQSYVSYSNGLDDYDLRALDKVIDIHLNEGEGDILLFLTGQEEIENACEQLEERVKAYSSIMAGELVCIPLFASMQNEQQRQILEKLAPVKKFSGTISRRCIVATNIAETSLTIDGIVFVVDPGFCKRKVFDPKTGIESLLVQQITRASAIQRAGRAGRTRAGKCFRLYSKNDYNQMKEIEPEINHSNLDNVVLRLKKFGIQDLFKFNFMNSPPRALLQRALDLLTNLEALDCLGGVTKLGAKMTDLPVDPPLARMLIESVRLGCYNEVIAICSMLSSSNCFFRPRNKQNLADEAKARFVNDRSDHLTLFRVYNAFVSNDRSEKWCFANFLNYRSLQYADDVHNQLQNVMLRLNLLQGVSSNAMVLYSEVWQFNILKALVAGSFMKVAYWRQKSGIFNHQYKGHYITVESQISGSSLPSISNSSNAKHCPEYLLHPSSVLFKPKQFGPKPEWVLFNEAIQLKGGKHYLQTVSVVRPEWLVQLAPKYYQRVPKGHELMSQLELANKKVKELSYEYSIISI